jgi:ribosomal protein S18 acetylase RimI-like enzyme
MEPTARKIDIKDLRVELLESRHKAVIKGFRTDAKKPEEVELRDFLIEDAIDNQEMEISSTYLFFHNPSNKLAGYVTVLSDAVRIHGTHLGKAFSDQGVPYKTLPAMKIARMCVDEGFKRKGIGTNMLLFAMGRLVAVNEHCGCRFLIVDAKRDAIHFYKRFSFQVLKEKEKGTLPLYYDMFNILKIVKETKTKLEAVRK